MICQTDHLYKAFSSFYSWFIFLVLHAMEKAFYWSLGCVCEVSCCQTLPVSRKQGEYDFHPSGCLGIGVASRLVTNCFINYGLSLSDTTWKSFITSILLSWSCISYECNFSALFLFCCSCFLKSYFYSVAWYTFKSKEAILLTLFSFWRYFLCTPSYTGIYTWPKTKLPWFLICKLKKFTNPFYHMVEVFPQYLI